MYIEILMRCEVQVVVEKVVLGDILAIGLAPEMLFRQIVFDLFDRTSPWLDQVSASV